MKTKWDNVAATFSIEVEYQDLPGTVFDTKGKELELLNDYVGEDDMPELVIDFRSSGYHDPGCTYGPPENCYPPEGDVEESLVIAYLKGDAWELHLPKDIQEKLFELYAEEITEVEIQTDEGRV